MPDLDCLRCARPPLPKGEARGASVKRREGQSPSPTLRFALPRYRADRVVRPYKATHSKRPLSLQFKYKENPL